MDNYFRNETLLESPTKRAAYSDRTSYLMAEMSRLAYFKFEGGNNIDQIIKQVRELIPGNNKLLAFEALIKSQVLVSSDKQGRPPPLTSLTTRITFRCVRTELVFRAQAMPVRGD